jgi:hypothetical protein
MQSQSIASFGGSFSNKTVLNEPLSSKIMTLMPNPAQNAVRGELPTDERFDLIVYDICGKAIYEGKNVMGITWIDYQTYPDGIYFVQARGDKNIVTKKLIKQ